MAPPVSSVHFEVANIVPTMIYDLLVGGMISSALVPVLSEVAADDRDKREFWRLFSVLISLAAVFMAGFVVVAEFLAPQIAWLFGARNFEDPQLLETTTQLLRLMLPAVLFLNLSGLITGALYSLKRFTLPAFTAAAFNAAIVLAALLMPEHIESLAWGRAGRLHRSGAAPVAGARAGPDSLELDETPGFDAYLETVRPHHPGCHR